MQYTDVSGVKPADRHALYLFGQHDLMARVVGNSPRSLRFL